LFFLCVCVCAQSTPKFYSVMPFCVNPHTDLQSLLTSNEKQREVLLAMLDDTDKPEDLEAGFQNGLLPLKPGSDQLINECLAYLSQQALVGGQATGKQVETTTKKVGEAFAKSVLVGLWFYARVISLEIVCDTLPRMPGLDFLVSHELLGARVMMWLAGGVWLTDEALEEPKDQMLYMLETMQTSLVAVVEQAAVDQAP